MLRDDDVVVSDFLGRARGSWGRSWGQSCCRWVLTSRRTSYRRSRRSSSFLPGDLRFAIELRQSRWMGCDVLPYLLELLARHGIALGLCDGRWIPRETMLEQVERATADFLLSAVDGAGPRDHRFLARSVRSFRRDARVV
jgi:hypothetical protein